MNVYDTAVIHGRFQILHNDHLKYLLAGKAMCRHLVVGITNPDPVLTNSVDSDPSRSQVLSNPLTYFERLVMTREVLLEAGLALEDMTITPLPITRPELFKYYVPMDALFVLSIYDGWGRQKLEQFKTLGLETHVLWEVAPEEKGISAQDIRELMLKGQNWAHLVPEASARLLKKWRIPDRLRQMHQESSQTG
ncbi:nicotinate-nucleotide adenylyltransferase [Desulfonatronospira sp.]|uniref:nicotinate-nucleotide adenylyltransferase n=1 Tax=Desulfonatronospira sp. TaxID=1962951 RepID=UPI0025B980AE|nr:nicotinate-nucleotide adenylyltransferase [Desulfonatronospira sp.]